MTDKEHWAVDKRIPLSSILAGAVFVVGQTFFLAWYVSTLNFRVATIEDFAKQMQPIPSEMAVMKEKITSIQASLNKIETIFFSRPDIPTQAAPVSPFPSQHEESKPTSRR